MLLATLHPLRAHAYQGRFGLDTNIVLESREMRDSGGLNPKLGVGATLRASLPVDDRFRIGASLGYTYNGKVNAVDSELHVIPIKLDAVYLLDIVSLVPYFGIGVGTEMVLGYYGGGDTTALEIRLPVFGKLGLHWFLTESFLLQLDGNVGGAFSTTESKTSLYWNVGAGACFLFDP